MTWSLFSHEIFSSRSFNRYSEIDLKELSSGLQLSTDRHAMCSRKWLCFTITEYLMIYLLRLGLPFDLFLVTASAPLKADAAHTWCERQKWWDRWGGGILFWLLKESKKKKKKITNVSQSPKLNTCCLARPNGKSTFLLNAIKWAYTQIKCFCFFFTFHKKICFKIYNF